jgi:hypothetical protein
MSFVDSRAIAVAHRIGPGFNPLRRANPPSDPDHVSWGARLQNFARRFGHRLVVAAAVTLLHLGLAKYLLAVLTLVRRAAASYVFMG